MKHRLGCLILVLTLITGAAGPGLPGTRGQSAAAEGAAESAPAASERPAPNAAEQPPETPEPAMLTFRNFSAPADSESLDLGKTEVKKAEMEAFCGFLSGFPQLRRVDMFASTVREAEVDLLTARFPEITFGWTMKVAGYTVRTDDTSFSTRHANESTRRGWESYRLLTHCPNLKALDLGHNAITSLEFLRELPQLRVLILADNKISDLSPIVCQRELEYIELFRNEIEDVSPLAELPHVMDLNLVFNRITDLTPLERMSSLKRLWINHYNSYNVDTPMDQEMLARLREALPNALVDSTAKSPTGNYWRKHPHYDAIARMFKNGGRYEPFEDSVPEP